MGNLLTRKDVGDKNGERTCYVLELRDIYSQIEKWYHPTRANDIYSSTYEGAVIIKEKYYKEFHRVNSDWTRKDFRVALYVRAER